MRKLREIHQEARELGIMLIMSPLVIVAGCGATLIFKIEDWTLPAASIIAGLVLAWLEIRAGNKGTAG